MTPAELLVLIDAAIEGEISEADFLRLEAELSVNAAARRKYYERVQLSLLLEAEAMAFPLSSEMNSSASDTRREIGRWHWAFAGMATACGILLTILASQWLNQNQNPVAVIQDEVPERSSESLVEQESLGFAILSGQADAVWDAENTLVTGEVVPPGELQLIRGLAQFELFSGVTLVVEGEARFSIVSPMEVSVARGKVRARVPEPARGFRMKTSTGEIVDLGTEFAVNVTDESSEVHVLDGEIEWHPEGLPSQRLVEGHATRTSPQGQIAFDAKSQDFVGTQELRQRLQEWHESRYELWKRKAESLVKDPRLVARYQSTSEAVRERKLPNLAEGSSILASEGAVVAAVPASNRWGHPGSALDFSPAGSRVRVHVPGEFQNLTLVCWVRINSLDRVYNSLFLTDGHELGEPHWQIMDDGRLFFSVKRYETADPDSGRMDKHIFYSPPFWNSSLSGRWLMLATVYDSNNRNVTHYLNGEVLSTETIPEEYLVTHIRIGDASLCNWGLPKWNKPWFAIRNLNGCLDEFLMFQEPLSAEEIQRLYRDGQP